MSIKARRSSGLCLWLLWMRWERRSLERGKYFLDVICHRGENWWLMSRSARKRSVAGEIALGNRERIDCLLSRSIGACREEKKERNSFLLGLNSILGRNPRCITSKHAGKRISGTRLHYRIASMIRKHGFSEETSSAGGWSDQWKSLPVPRMVTNNRLLTSDRNAQHGLGTCRSSTTIECVLDIYFLFFFRIYQMFCRCCLLTVTDDGKSMETTRNKQKPSLFCSLFSVFRVGNRIVAERQDVSQLVVSKQV